LSAYSSSRSIIQSPGHPFVDRKALDILYATTNFKRANQPCTFLPSQKLHRELTYRGIYYSLHKDLGIFAAGRFWFGGSGRIGGYPSLCCHDGWPIILEKAKIGALCQHSTANSYEFSARRVLESSRPEKPINNCRRSGIRHVIEFLLLPTAFSYIGPPI
jgi:hypothetical protein